MVPQTRLAMDSSSSHMHEEGTYGVIAVFAGGRYAQQCCIYPSVRSLSTQTSVDEGQHMPLQCPAVPDSPASQWFAVSYRVTGTTGICKLAIRARQMQSRSNAHQNNTRHCLCGRKTCTGLAAMPGRTADGFARGHVVAADAGAAFPITEACRIGRACTCSILLLMSRDASRAFICVGRTTPNTADLQPTHGDRDMHMR